MFWVITLYSKTYHVFFPSPVVLHLPTAISKLFQELLLHYVCIDYNGYCYHGHHYYDYLLSTVG